MKAVYIKISEVILLAISLSFVSCTETEIIKVLKAPGWVHAEVKSYGIVTLTWEPVEEAVMYYIHCSTIERDISSSEYRIGSAETTTFTHHNKNYQSVNYVYYGVCMVDDKGKCSRFKTQSVMLQE